jgi:hypothetical protein
MALTNPRDMALAHLDRLQAFYPRAEGKASFLFAVNIGMAGVLAANGAIGDLITAKAVPGWACLFFLSLSVIGIFGAFFPHLKGATKRSMIYFGDIAALKSADFVDKAKHQTDDDITDDAHCQIWRNSEILKKKFDRTKFAFLTTVIAIPPWLWALSLVAQTTGVVALKAG